MRGIGDFLYEYLGAVNDGKQQSLKQARPERGAPFFLPHRRIAQTREFASAQVRLRGVARAPGTIQKEIFAFSKIFVHNLLTSAYIGV